MPANDEVVLSLRDLSKKFGNGCDYCRETDAELQKNMCPECHTVYAVRNTSLDLYKGEILGIVGESGSGKSTLMKTLYFDQEATGGEYILPGDASIEGNVFNVSSHKNRQIPDEQPGMVYQNPTQGRKMGLAPGTKVP